VGKGSSLRPPGRDFMEVARKGAASRMWTPEHLNALVERIRDLDSELLVHVDSLGCRELPGA
jgi:hypothetical protein